MINMIKRILCKHDWKHIVSHNTAFTHRECAKCNKLEAGDYASDGRFYWVKSAHKRHEL